MTGRDYWPLVTLAPGRSTIIRSSQTEKCVEGKSCSGEPAVIGALRRVSRLVAASIELLNDVLRVKIAAHTRGDSTLTGRVLYVVRTEHGILFELLLWTFPTSDPGGGP